MPIKGSTEQQLETEALDMLEEEGWEVVYGPSIAPASEGGNGERGSYKEVVLVERLKRAISKINPKIPKEAQEEAVKKVLRHESQDIISDNRDFHKMIFEGVPVSYRADGRIKNDHVWLIDFEDMENNEFLAINQFTIIENDFNRRPDILLFVNGLPLVLFELKNPADEKATVKDAYDQVQTYKKEISSLFRYGEIIVISDGMETLAGTLTSGTDRFVAWKTINGKDDKKKSEIELMIRGMLNKKTVIDLVKDFIVFQEEKGKNDSLKISKKVASYPQYDATNEAIGRTIKATKDDRRAGIVWHTQGVGKSLTMVFYSRKTVLCPELENPTIVVLTDRNDLDDQLFDTFASCNSLLRQTPVQSHSRDHLKELLKVASGGIVFTTIQKFFPDEKGGKFSLLSNRRNIIVMADEAHRSQYDFIDGFARHLRDALPNASFIGFTGTPIEKKDRSTPAVFGDYIHVYDMERAKEDKLTVGIFYESRLAKLELKPEERLKIDPNFEEVTEGQEVEGKEKLKSKWARMEAVVGSKERVKRVAKDIVEHFEARTGILTGKAIIVCMSRRICVELHDEIIKLKPEWYHKEDEQGEIKVIMTGSAKETEWQEHIRNKPKRKRMGERFKDPSDPLKIAIVRDMWLTGFDAPCLHTMYLDKPMQGHGLMQAIARVNRVFKDKTGGLVVDYIGIADELKKALSNYTASGGKGKPFLDKKEAIRLMLSECEIVRDLLHGFDYKSRISAPLREKLPAVRETVDFIIGKDREDKRKERFLKHSKKFIDAYSLSTPSPEALKLSDEIGFIQLVRAQLNKLSLHQVKRAEELDSAIRQIISKAVISDRIVDIFESVGLNKPNIEILSNEFLTEVRGMPQKNLAFEALKKLLNEEIRLISRKNIVKGHSFMEMLDKTIKKYHNRAVETAQLVEELIALAKTIKKDQAEGKKLGLTEDEIAFYDALYVNDSAVKVLGDKTLMLIARELLKTIRDNVTIDWTLRENVQANLRVKVKRILSKYGYPPDKQKLATDTVLKQAEVIAKDWAEK